MFILHGDSTITPVLHAPEKVVTPDNITQIETDFNGADGGISGITTKDGKLDAYEQALIAIRHNAKNGQIDWDGVASERARIAKYDINGDGVDLKEYKVGEINHLTGADATTDDTADDITAGDLDSISDAFKNADKNNNQFIDQGNEFNNNTKALLGEDVDVSKRTEKFNEIDKNGDHKLSKAEIEAYRANKKAKRPGEPPNPGDLFKLILLLLLLLLFGGLNKKDGSGGTDMLGMFKSMLGGSGGLDISKLLSSISGGTANSATATTATTATATASTGAQGS